MLGDTEVDVVEIAFSQAGLNGWIREGNRIRIPSETRSEYLAALQESAAIPMSLRSSMQQALSDSNIFEASEQRQSREMYAKEQDLGLCDFSISRRELRPRSNTIEVSVYGLSRARPQSASVVVQPQGNQPLSQARIEMIKELIRGSFASMTADDVVVIDTNGNASGFGGSDDDPLLRKQREAEAYFEQKVRSVLSGYGPIRVAAFAEIDPTMDTEKTVLTYDEPTTLSSKQKTLASKTTRPEQGGVPGAGPNANVTSNRATSIDAVRGFQRLTKAERENSSVAGTRYENSRLASLQVQRVRVTVGLPESYYEKVWRQKQLRENPT